MRLLLDTSAAILLRDGDAEAHRRLAEAALIPALSIISLVELEGGVVATPGSAPIRRALLDEMLREIPVLDFDAPCADTYRRIVETVGLSRARVADRMIAATAIVHDLTLVTTNPRDVRDVPDLALEVWPAPTAPS